MTLPTFVGIGVPRAGTTWLHTLLSGHPDAYLPTRRKEVRFFDRHFDRGVEWYEGFFSPPEGTLGYRAIGEISPQYLYGQECPARIATVVPSAKLLVMLRHPVDRAYSQYGFLLQRRNYRGSFEEFLKTRPRALEMGYYSGHLRRYLDRFDRDGPARPGRLPRHPGGWVPGGNRTREREHHAQVSADREPRRQDRSTSQEAAPGIDRRSGRSIGCTQVHDERHAGPEAGCRCEERAQPEVPGRVRCARRTAGHRSELLEGSAGETEDGRCRAGLGHDRTGIDRSTC